MSGFQVFLIQPANVITYNLENPLNGEGFLYNAGSLSMITDLNITWFNEISGIVTDRFGVDPVVLAYANGSFSLIYAPCGMNTVFDSNGQPAKHMNCVVTGKSQIKIPDLDNSMIAEQSVSLTCIQLQSPNEASLQAFIELSKKGIEQSMTQSFDELNKTETKVFQAPEPTMVQSGATSSYSDPSGSNLSPEPVRSYQEPIKTVDLSTTEMLQQKIVELEYIVRALNQRLYRIYPVEIPMNLHVQNKEVQLLSVDDIQSKIDAGEIERYEMDPLIQPFAGSHRSNNRMFTFHGRDGSIYLVRGEYDTKTNKITAPK